MLEDSHTSRGIILGQILENWRENCRSLCICLLTRRHLTRAELFALASMHRDPDSIVITAKLNFQAVLESTGSAASTKTKIQEPRGALVPAVCMSCNLLDIADVFCLMPCNLLGVM